MRGARAGTSFARLNRRQKIKGAYLLYKNSDRAAGGHISAWGTGYDLSWWSTQMDKAVGMGANTVGLGMNHRNYMQGTTQAAAALTHLREHLDAARARNLMVHWCMSADSEWDATDIPTQAAAVGAIAAVLHEYPNVVAIDGINEYITSADVNRQTRIAAYSTAIRANTNIPISYSLNGFASTYAPAFEPYLDYYSAHPYWLASGIDPTTDTQIIALRALSASTGKPWMISEVGQTADKTNAEILSRWTQVGQLSALPDCLGAIGFCMADFDTAATNRYGIYDTTQANPRTDVQAIFSTWPGRR